jgi:nucleotide-binding universal stress UspA family protein
MTTTIKPGSVVVGVDASPDSDAAVIWAAGYAALTSRPLLLVCATGEVTPLERLRGAVKAQGTNRMTARRSTDAGLALAHRVAPGLDISAVHPAGDARAVLIGLARQASILVVGSRGHGPVATLVLGSVSVAVATHAQCAVAVVRPREEPAARIVVGVSGDGSDGAALEFAAELASAEGVELDAVHAWSTGDAFVDAMSYEQRRESMDRHERALAEAVAGLAEKYPDVQINRYLPDDGPVHALVSRSERAECVVVGSRGRSGPHVLLGSVSRALVERAHSTVVVVRP